MSSFIVSQFFSNDTHLSPPIASFYKLDQSSPCKVQKTHDDDHPNQEQQQQQYMYTIITSSYSPNIPLIITHTPNIPLTTCGVKKKHTNALITHNTLTTINSLCL